MQNNNKENWLRIAFTPNFAQTYLFNIFTANTQSIIDGVGIVQTQLYRGSQPPKLNLAYRLLISSLFCIVLLNAGVASSNPLKIQGKPLVRSFSSYEYKGHEQNWSMLIAPSGLLYVGNGEGILEYDGINWRHIETPYAARVRSLDINKSGRIFAGSHNSFGYLTEGALGQLEFVDISQSIKQEDREFEDIWTVKVVGEVVYFVASKILFRLNADGSLQSWRTPLSHLRGIESLNGNIYITSKKEVYQIKDDQLVVSPIHSNGQSLSNIIRVLPLENEELIFSGEGIFSLPNDSHDIQSIQPWKNSASQALAGKRLYKMSRFGEGFIVVTTIGDGVFLFDENGSNLIHFGVDEGLVADIVLAIGVDHQDGLWLGLEGGIARIQSPTNISISDASLGLDSPNEMINYREEMLIATQTGVAVLLEEKQSNKYSFQYIDNFSKQIFSLIPIHRGILAAGNGGIYQIEWNEHSPLQSRISHIVDYGLVYGLIESLWFDNEYFVNLDDGFARLRWDGNQWLFEKINEIKGQVRGLVFDQYGLWLATVSGKVYRVEKFDRLADMSFELFSQDKGVMPANIKIFPNDDGVLIAGNEKLAQYNFKNNRFDMVGQIDPQYEIQYLRKDSEQQYWLGTEYDIGTIKDLQSLEQIDFSFSRLLVSSRALELLNFDDQNYLVRSRDLVKYKTSQFEFKKADVLLRKTHPSALNSLHQSLIQLDSHDVKFHVALPDFANPVHHQYRFKIDDNRWSEWSKTPSNRFSNLSGGRHELSVQATNYSGKLSQRVFPFNIKLYWYETLWFKLLVIVGLLLLIWMIVRYSTYRLRQRNIQLEELVQKRTQIITDQSKELERLNKARTRFFTHVSHELRTPLTLTIGPLQEILDGQYGKFSNGVKQAMGLVLRSASSMQSLLNQVLDLSRMESGALSLKLKPVELVNELKLCSASFELLAEKQQISFNKIYSQQSLNIEIDPKGLRSIINNLLSNAFKFTSTGGIIQLELIVQSNDIFIQISDSGCGINKAELPHIFDQYYQAETKDLKKYSGTGIGLSMVREYVKLHGGDIQVISQQGKGTTFKVRLPLIVSTEEPSTRPFTAELNQKEMSTTFNQQLMVKIKNGDCPTVLIVEDNDELRQFIARRLSETYRVLEAENGQQALKIVKQHIPDVIITDIMMPIMDGHELCKVLKSSRKTDYIPLVMLTSKSTGEEIVEGINLGADDYLAKPFSMPELLARVRRLIESRLVLRERYSKNEFVFKATDKKQKKRKVDESEAFLSRIREVVLTQEPEGFGVKELADALAMDRTTLYRKLKIATGGSVVEAIRSIRLEEAASLFKANQGNVTEVAYGVGFKSLGHFSRSFNSYFGQSPSDFKAEYDC